MAALNFPANPTNGQTYENYVYDGTDGVWKRISPGGTLGNIDDVTIDSPADGQALVYDSSAGDWVNETLALTSTIEDLTDTTIASPSEGDTMVYDGSSWINTPATSGNAIINGDFGIWQRGTSFSDVSSDEYTADRWLIRFENGTTAITREAFTPGELSLHGYGSPEYFLRETVTGAGLNQRSRISTRIEGVETLAGQTVTLSFYAKASENINLANRYTQNFGSGGSGELSVIQYRNITTSWDRYSFTFLVPSISGRTIGAGSYLELSFFQNASLADFTLDLWGVQLEAGSVATPFKLAGGGSKAAELALCQRYYYFANTQNAGGFAYKYSSSASAAFNATGTFPTQLRTSPSVSQIASGILNSCTDRDLVADTDNWVHRVDVTGTGTFRAYGQTYAIDAEL